MRRWRERFTRGEGVIGLATPTTDAASVGSGSHLSRLGTRRRFAYGLTMRRSLLRFAFFGAGAATSVSCVDDSSPQPALSASTLDGGSPGEDAAASSGDAGATPDAAAPLSDAAGPDTSTPGSCSIAGNNYRIYGSQLFKVSEDLTMSYLVGNVANDKGLPFASSGSSTTGTQVGTTLVVADPNCPFCSIALPPNMVNGTVNAQPVTTGLSNIHFFYSPSIPNNVVVWSGNGTSFTLYDLANKTAPATASIAISGPGVLCNKLYSISGSIMPTAYSVRILAECGDGSGPTWATVADTGGTKVGSTWQQDSYQVAASAKTMVTNPQIIAGELTRGIFLGSASKVYVINAGTFVPDTAVYQQCNPLTGTSVSGARPLIPAPR